MLRNPIWAVALSVSAGFGGEASPLRLSPAPGSPFAVAGQPNGVASADLNADAKADLVVTHGPSSVSILLGNGRGGFSHAPGSPLPVSSRPHLAAPGDLDGDAKLDLVVTGHDSHGVFVWRGDGTGRFEPVRGSPFPALPDGKPHNHGLALGDLDGDGKLDAVTTHDDVALATVLVGDGQGGLRPLGPPLDVRRRAAMVRLHDMDRDGKTDVVMALGGAVALLLGNGRGGWTPVPGSPFPVGRGAWSLAIADFDGDGRSDVATADLEAGTLSVLLQR